MKSLAVFALMAILNNKITFTWEEIKSACPNIDKVPGAINGFGLLHAIEGYNNLQKSVTLTFIHLSVQEYLAAYRISCLQQQQESQALKRFFNERSSSISYLNVAQMYVGLTKGQRPAFKELLGNFRIHLECYFSYNFSQLFFSIGPFMKQEI